MIAVDHLSLKVGEFALENITFEVPTGQYAVLMGRTGAGKTTLLEALCGLKTLTGGTIRLHGRDVTHLKPAERGIGYVPQDRALFQTMTVREHLAFALMIQKKSRDAIRHRVAELSRLLGIEHLLDRKPQGLSGGEAQRVALGRALSIQPGILCLDEPLNALDDDTRQEMYALMGQVRKSTGVTILHVTHNLDEATRLADLLFRLQNGKVERNILTTHLH
ncbi:MAG TPA: ATP-binding cassette domain-containing protein [Candidatus Paceibacterota bacterium]|nr:ATP-binding cassette domain-containing protein [Verrucomicrobiota bacterium]HRY50810.1 ATP-binding cassette domain-containing protein [Candidatus Paceibacterota bacterium]HSA03586.1 ATP-binding cassette domain-containing protein [Candidatus Paceibacterota bacterium]